MIEPKVQRVHFPIDLWLVISLIIAVLSLALIDLIQYSKFGPNLLLGWDSPTYAWWAAQVQANGALSMILTWHYTWVYVLILAGAGTLVGSVILAERILPLLLFLPLAFAFYQIVFEISSNKKLGYLACVLSAITIDSIAIYSDLNRELVAYGTSLIVGVMVAKRLSKGQLNWKNDHTLILVKWLPLMAIVAFTQMETYGVLVLSLLPLFILSRQLRTVVIGGSTMLAPVLVAVPLMLPLYQGYLNTVATYLQSPTKEVLYDVWIFLGGYAIPFTVLGLAYLLLASKAGNYVGRFLLSWLIVLLLISPIAEEIGVGLIRVVLLVPVPVLGVLGLAELIQIFQRFGRIKWFASGLSNGEPAIKFRGIAVSTMLVAVLLIPTVLTTFPNTDNWLAPYANPQDVSRLQLAANLARNEGYTNPLLILFGSDVIQLWSAYFGVENPNTLPYYGKLQYIFTLPNPSSVYTFYYDPAYEMKYSTDYTDAIRSAISSVSDITSRAIVVVEGGTYNRPISEVFLNSTFEVSKGIFIIPPNSLNARQVDDWRLYAYDDRSPETGGYGYMTSWATAPLVLESVMEPPNAMFEANYTISLLHSWASMNFTLHYRDWSPNFTFRDNSTARLAPLDVLLDSRIILVHNYTGTGVTTIQVPLRNLNAGLHRISIQSGAPGDGVVVTLDYLEIKPA